MAEQVIIEFIPDFSQIEGALTQLEKLGSIDKGVADQFRTATSEINKQAQALKNTASSAAPLKKGLEDVVKATKSVTSSFLQGFEQGIIETLHEAGVSAEDFAAALTKPGKVGGDGFKTVKQELRALTEQLAQAKASGKDFGAEYEALRKRAGALKDAIGDANQEVKNFASDTSTFDGLINLTQGITGGFAVAQGAVALFGDESEEMQKTLLKVNAAMAILQGLQSIQNTALKESAAAKLLDRAATNAQTIAQRTYALVVGETTGVVKALRIAMASTGIGLLLIAIGALVANWDSVKASISGVSREQEMLAENAKELVKNEEEKLEALDSQDNILKAQGKTEKEILTLKIKQTDAVIEAREQELLNQESILKSQIAAEKRNREILSGILKFLTAPLVLLEKTIEGVARLIGKDIDLPSAADLTAKYFFDEDAVKKEGEAAQKELQKQILELKNKRAGYSEEVKGIDRAAHEQGLKDYIASIEKRYLAAAEGSAKQLDLQKKLINAKAALDIFGAKSEAERELIVQKVREESAEADAAFQKRGIELKIQGIERELQAVKAGSIEELRLRQDLLQQRSKADLTNTKLSEDEKLEIIRKSNEDQVALGREYGKKATAQAIADTISRNNAELAALEISSGKRLELIISNIDLEARAEIEAAENNAARIAEINANRDNAIRNARLAALKEWEEREIEAINNVSDHSREYLRDVVDNQRLSVKDRIAALEELRAVEIAIIDKQIEANTVAQSKGLITIEEGFKKYLDLLKKKNKLEEEADGEHKAILNENTKAWIDVAIGALQEIAGLFQSISELQAEKDQQRIEAMRASLEAAKEAGAITEKEAKAREKRIEAEEKAARVRAAQRDKQMAIFNAIINTASAVTAALTLPPPFGFIQAAIVGAMGAAQIALIAARPIPKFGKGKKDNYEGIAEVGETGAELIERDGRMYVVDKSTITWLGAKDKVYNPEETKHILKQNTHTVSPGTKTLMHPMPDKSAIHHQQLMKDTLLAIKQVNKTISKLPITKISFDQDGFTRSIHEGLNQIKYFETRYGL